MNAENMPETSVKILNEFPNDWKKQSIWKEICKFVSFRIFKTQFQSFSNGLKNP